MSMFGPTGTQISALEMLAAQIRGQAPQLAQGPVSIFPQGGGVNAGLMGQGVGNIMGAGQFGARVNPIGIAARTAVPGGGAALGRLGGAMAGGGAPFSLARSFGPGTAAVGGGVGAGEAAGAAGLLGGARGTLGALATGIKGAPLKALGRGGAAGIAASFLANPVIEAAVPGEGGQVEKSLKGVATGAGIGAAVGAPFAGVGALPGALVGGGAGLLMSFLGGGKKKGAIPDAEHLKDAMAEAGIDPQTGAFILNRYMTTLKLAESDDEKKQAYAEAKQLIIDAIAPTGGQSPFGQAPQAWTPEQMMAMQAQSAELMRPLAAQAQGNAQAHAQLIGQLTQGMDPGVANLLRSGAAGEITASQRLVNAYQAQAQLAPIAAMWEQQNQYRDQISNQLLQQAIGGIINPQTQASASPLSLDSLGL